MSLISRLLQEISKEEKRTGESQCFIGHEFRHKDLRVKLECALERLDLQAYFADREVTGEFILTKVCKKILVTRASIVDLTMANPNVYFELGVAIGLNKPVFVVLKHGTPVPPLLENFVKLRFISYAGLERELVEQVPGWLEQSIEHHLLYSTHCHFVNVLCRNRQRITPKRRYLVIDQIEDAEEAGQPTLTHDADLRAELPAALDRFHFDPIFLDDVALQDTFRLCDYCRTMRDGSFALCHLSRRTSPNVYLLLGLVTGLNIPSLLMVHEERDKKGRPLFEIPTMLRGLDAFYYEHSVDISERLGNEVEGFLNLHKGKPLVHRTLVFPDLARREALAEQYEGTSFVGPVSTSLPSEIVAAARRGDLVLFIGADLPASITGAPNRCDLAQRFAQRFGIQPVVSLEKVAEQVENRFGRNALISFFKEMLDTTGRSLGLFYRTVSRLPLRTIVTTTYDDLLEKSLRESSRPVLVLASPTDLPLVGHDRVSLFRLAGDLARPESLAITERDAAALIEHPDHHAMLRHLARELIQQTVLVLGQDVTQPVFEKLYEETVRLLGNRQLPMYIDSSSLATWSRQVVWADLRVIDANPLAILQSLSDALAAKDIEGVASVEREAEAIRLELSTIQQMSNAADQADMIVQVVHQLAELGDTAGLRQALGLTQCISLSTEQARALVAVLDALVQVRDAEGVRRVVELALALERHETSDQVLEATVHAYQALGEHRKAAEVDALWRGSSHVQKADLVSGIVRIIKRDGQVVGAGFVLTEDGFIATCAHVVESANAGPGEIVRLIFQSTSDQRQAIVTPDSWRSPNAEDVAILRLEGTLPAGVTPLPFGSSESSERYSILTYGYPSVMSEGMWARCEFIGHVAMKGHRMLQLSSDEVTLGFAGAPAWDEVTGRVIGMINSILMSNRFGGVGGMVFATPAELLRQVYMKLKPVAQVRLGVPFQAPPLPPEFVGREAELSALKAALVSNDRPIALTALQGLAGIGKTTLAATLAHDSEIQAALPDGVLWVSLGQRPDVVLLLAGWIQALGDYEFHPTNVESASARLRTLLHNKACLLVVDDAWDPAHVRPFLVGGDRCKALITTRNARVAGAIGADRYDLGVMTPEEALMLLSRRLGRPLKEAEREKALALCRILGFLPLALEMAAARLMMGDTWERLVTDFSKDKHLTVDEIIEWVTAKTWTPAHALAVVRGLEDERQRAEALASLAPHLSTDLLMEALVAVREIPDVDGRVNVLAALVPHLPEAEQAAVLQEALAAARAIESEEYRAKALAGLAPQLAELGYLEEALVAVQAIQSGNERAEVLMSLVRYLPEPLRSQTLRTSLEDKDLKVRRAAIELALESATGKEFEELCVEVLKREGFDNMSAPYQSGQVEVDILAERRQDKALAVGEPTVERWVVDCKRANNVRRQYIDQVLRSVVEMEADVGLLISSGTLTEPMSQETETLNKKLAPSSVIFVWDRSTLLDKLQDHPELLERFM